MDSRKRILVTPLDWGLGHAARCIPIIRELVKRNCEVMIASNGRALNLMEREFPLLTKFEISAYDPVYPDGSSMVWTMAVQIPKFMRAIKKEHEEIRKIANSNGINLIISDNRYGCSHPDVKSIIITHQLNILMPEGWKWIENTLNKFNRKWLGKFNECWVPTSNELPVWGLTGGEHAGLCTKEIGLLSRMEKKQQPNKYRICVLCTGPEPQRSFFEELFTDKFKDKDYNSILIKSQTEKLNPYYNKGAQHVIANYLASDEMNNVMEQSEVVISRPGYSTIMDLAKLGKKAIFIPTPGQTEQEYLAKELMERGIAFSVKQEDFDLETALKESEKYTGFGNFEQNEVLLKKTIDSVL